MSWLHRVLGKDGTSQLGVDSTHFAARVSSRPMHMGTRGAYSLAQNTGIIAAGTTGEIFQARWIDANKRCLLRSVAVSWAVSTTAYIAGVPPTIGMKIARGWTGDGTGGTAIVMSTANTNKKRTDFPLSLFSDTGVRIATTTGLGAGTKNLDTNYCAMAMGAAAAATGSTVVLPYTILWQRNTPDEYPFLFEQNEGFMLAIVEQAGTGTSKIGVQMEWAEVDPTEVEGWA